VRLSISRCDESFFVDWKQLALIYFEENIFNGYSVVASTTQIECDTFRLSPMVVTQFGDRKGQMDFPQLEETTLAYLQRTPVEPYTPPTAACL
jgi:hypothetical protein